MENKKFQITYIYKEQKLQYTFPPQSPISFLFLKCQKTFNLQSFTLTYNSINLNFIDKSTPLIQIFPESELDKELTIKVVLLPAKDVNFEHKESQLNQQYTKNIQENISINKGEISQILLNKTYSKSNIHSLSLTPGPFSRGEIASFLSEHFDSNKLSLKVPLETFIHICEIYEGLRVSPISKIKSLTVYNTTNKNVEIKRDVRCVNIFLDDLEEITLINVNIQFAKPFPSLKRIRVVNSFGYCYYDITKYWENIDYLSLEYQYIEDLMFFMGALENKVKSLSVLKIKLNSIDLENKLNWNAFCAFDLFVKANEIYLNIKSKLLFDENVDETSSRIMNKVKEFKLLPYNRIKPEIIEAYLTNSKEQLTKLTLLKIKNVKLPNIATIIEDKCPNLELIDIDEPENENNNNTLNEYKYKIHLRDDFSLLNNGNFFNSYNYMKIQKIELPFLYFNKKRKELLIRGDAIGSNKQSLFKCEPNQDPESYVIDQTFYTFMDNVLSNTPFLNKVIIRNFENPKTSSMDILTFLNNVLITYQHALIEVPKIKKIKLIDLVLDTSIMANIGFLLKINEKSLKKVELNNIKIISNELGGDNVVDDSAIHLNDLFRFSSFPITKVSFKNFQGDSNIKPIIEHELLQRTKILSLESITNYDISNVINRVGIEGIELRNLEISDKELYTILKNNKYDLQYLSIDLQIADLFKYLLEHEEIQFPNLRVLKIYESFDSNTSDKIKQKFLEDKWKYMKKLKKVHILFKNDNTKGKKKLLDLYNYLQFK